VTGAIFPDFVVHCVLAVFHLSPAVRDLLIRVVLFALAEVLILLLG